MPPLNCSFGFLRPIPGRTESEEQLFARWVFNFKVLGRQSPKLFENGLSHAVSQEFGMDGRQDLVLSEGFHPSSQNCKLFRPAAQVLENSREENPQKIANSQILSQVGRIRRFQQNLIHFAADWLMRNPAGRMPPEVADNTADNLLEVVNEAVRIFEMAPVDCAPISGQLRAVLNRKHCRINDLFSAYSGQVPCQPRIVAEIAQQVLGQFGQLPPLFRGNTLQSGCDISGLNLFFLRWPGSGCFSFHVQEARLARFLNGKADWKAAAGRSALPP
jgi:hypothetical protein